MLDLLIASGMIVDGTGNPGFYGRFGFVPAQSLGIAAPDPSWGDYFQVRTLTTYAGQTGRFRYASPFERL